MNVKLRSHEYVFVGCFSLTHFPIEIEISNPKVPEEYWKNILNTMWEITNNNRKLHYYTKSWNTTRLEQKHTKWLFQFWWRETPWKKNCIFFVNTSPRRVFISTFSLYDSRNSGAVRWKQWENNNAKMGKRWNRRILFTPKC